MKHHAVKHLARAHAWIIVLGGRMREDRGDSPVPTSIIIAGLAAFAVVVIVAVTATGGRFLDTIRNLNP